MYSHAELDSASINKIEEKALTDSDFRQNDKRKAFTLAEVLITLGIIGIVAALTIPALMQKHFEKQRVTQLKKVYSELQQAYVMAVSEYGEPQNWNLTITSSVDNEGNRVYDFTGADNIASIFSKYLKVAKRCKKDEVCFPELGEYIYPLIGNTKADSSFHGIQKGNNVIQLVDGTAVGFGWVTNTDCTNVFNNENIACADVVVMFPQKKTVREGIDRFFFVLTKKGIKPVGYDFPNRCTIKSSDIYNGRNCTSWVLYNENMDYLHCDDLSWTGKTRCK